MQIRYRGVQGREAPPATVSFSELRAPLRPKRVFVPAVSRRRVFAWTRPGATGPRWPCSPPTTKALPKSEIAQYEQNDNHRSDNPDDVVHDALPKFYTPSIATRRVGGVQRCAGPRLPRECVPRGNGPEIAGARSR
jgi:hypothetical protein